MDVQTLYMYFLDELGNKISITMPKPRIDLTEGEVQAAMNAIISNNIFFGKGGLDLVSLHSAQVVTRSVSEYEVV